MQKNVRGATIESVHLLNVTFNIVLDRNFFKTLHNGVISISDGENNFSLSAQCPADFSPLPGRLSRSGLAADCAPFFGTSEGLVS